MLKIIVMYSYHNTIKKRIKNGELDKILIIDDGEYLFALVFKTSPTVRPIRYRSAHIYIDVLKNNPEILEKLK